MKIDQAFFTASITWKEYYPDAQVGILAIDNVTNPEDCPALDVQKGALENHLRRQFSGQTRQEIEAISNIQAYTTYLKPFKKTYHVLLQLESVALKGKSIPRVAALVEAMFMAELQSQLLTAGHDLDALHLPISIEVARGEEQYILRNGQGQVLKPNDMYIKDQMGIISDIIYGPDLRTQINPDTKRVIFTVYAPAGIRKDDVVNHMETMREYINLVSPKAKTIAIEVISSGK